MKKSKLNNNVAYQVIWLSLFPMLLIVSFYISWHLLSTQNFLYEFWYDNTKLEKFIDFYAPQNINKPEFAFTTREERIRVFSETLKAINNSGEGLAKIKFYSSDGRILGTLLNNAEVLHLDLVSNMVNLFNSVAQFCLVLSILFIALLSYKKIKTPKVKKIVIGYFFSLLLCGSITLLIGAERVFIFLHEKIFPENHQWFFYYQDSLMTTFMMAPDLFAYFSLVWLGMAVVIFSSLVFAVSKVYRKLLLLDINYH